MITKIISKLPMRNKLITKEFYTKNLGFEIKGKQDFEGYLMIEKDSCEIHFFEFTSLDPLHNYGQIYIRTNDINLLYNTLIENNTSIHPNGKLQIKPWGQKEFSLLDPDYNLITFGESI
jgi:catechol 2,3-dioxygenase-like lactoylglutathione lyase family enzyme